MNTTAKIIGLVLGTVVGLGWLGYPVYERLTREPVVVAAAQEDVVPCDFRKSNPAKERFEYVGPGYMHRKNGQIMSHCLPCAKAKTAAEKYVCEGDTE